MDGVGKPVRLELNPRVNGWPINPIHQGGGIVPSKEGLKKEVLIMDQVQEIFQAITGKGWVLYYRGRPNAKVPYEETFAIGPVNSLEKEILYVLQPKTDDPTNRVAVRGVVARHQLLPKITVPPRGFSHYGRILYQFGGAGGIEKEIADFLIPGQELPFVGIELQDDEVRILSRSMSYMPYEVFLEAIQSLEDIGVLIA